MTCFKDPRLLLYYGKTAVLSLRCNPVPVISKLQVEAVRAHRLGWKEGESSPVEAASMTTSRGSQGLSALHVVPAAPLRRAQGGETT